jgi:hypothetical protein
VAVPYADAAVDLAPRWRPLTEDEIVQANTLLEDAAFWLDTWVPGLRASVDSGAAAAVEGAKLVSVSMVKRAMQAAERDTPAGAESTYEMAGIYVEQIKYRNPDGALFLYDRELNDLLRLVHGGANTGAASFTAPGLYRY